MSKIRLDIDDLRVDTFATTPEAPRAVGTVDALATGQIDTCFDPSCRPRLCPVDTAAGQATCGSTCANTCAQTCPNTCAYTCDDPTCAYTCWNTCDDFTCVCGSGQPNTCFDSCTCPI